MNDTSLNDSGSSSSPSAGRPPARQMEEKETVVIRFAGDSGDGMQLTGTQFTNTAALFGNDLATFPDYPAEIRAPAGTMAGVSGFQIQFGHSRVFTPGDRADVLVAMNPAALRASLPEIEPGTLILLNSDAFDERALEKAGYARDPRHDGTLDNYRVIEVPLTSVTLRALEDSPLSHKERERSKNFFALGLLYWMYSRPVDYTKNWIKKKFANRPDARDANLKALEAGYNYGLTTEEFATTYSIKPADIEAGTYRNITGNQALALGFVAASQQSGVDLFLGSYPITPASDILHELSRYKNFGVRTFQAEDEIAAVGAAIGAAYGGAIGLTTSSGPGIALKGEAIGLAVMVELPLVIVDVQRGGPSTGLPTKTEQADLNLALFGRNSECPAVVLAASTPSDCFWTAIEAVRLAIKYMTPVFLLSDGYIANGAEPFRIPEISDIPKIQVSYRTDATDYHPYMRDPETLARPWVRPGTPGLEHRIGGLEKEDITGEVSYDPANHEHMVRTRQAKIERVANDIPSAPVYGEETGDVLLIGWGGTFGALFTAVRQMREEGYKISHVHLTYLNPMPRNIEPLVRGFKKVVVAELNLGQLKNIIRARFLVDALGINKVQGQPFKVSELVARLKEIIGGIQNAG